ncbi:glycoside hydrolase family 5 protein [Allonocardiopsis opalescens]|uniref:cellulase n=1 Tax=Allonocardiopsis opalescens TaxID=1144618 RepID=A0A2T0PUD8_9ACTN|nr:glycoside hydrolase family 5 protein [Allonocardiopsis opalescens]PRX92513.1 endoglucanase [Allonocardiopsis opalescens]
MVPSVPSPAGRPARRVRPSLLAVLSALLLALLPLAPAPAGASPAPVAAGPLHVCGTRLCDAGGRPVQLRGMSTHGLQWYAHCVTGASLDALAQDWRADVVRVSMYVQEGGYETDPAGYTDLVDGIVDQVTARGMYAIVDFHLLTPGDPTANLGNARTFFAEISRRQAGNPNVLYEIANEPNGVGWSTIRGYAEQVIPVIRANDPDSVVLVGTRAWSSLGVSEGGSEQEIVNDPVRADNIMYTFHFYAATHGQNYLDTLDRASRRLPVFVTEFGTQTSSGDGGNDFAMADRYLALMAERGISWVNWNFSDDFRSGAVFREGTCGSGGPWTGTGPLKPAGVWVREHIRAG